MNQGLVSIVIPTYNDDPLHLRQAVDSALTQTYPHIEVVVVDDGSTRPETVAAVDALDNVTVIRQYNAGLPRARNVGIRASSGAFVLPVDADNWIESQTVDRLVSALSSAGSDVVAAYPRVLVFGTGEGELPLPTHVRLADLAVRNYIDACALFRRADWDRVGGYLEQREAPEDWVLWIQMLSTGTSMVNASEAVLHYRLREGSLNTRFEDKEAALRQIADVAGTSLSHLYVGAAMTAQELLVEVETLRAFHRAWAPRVGPLLRIRDALRRNRVTRTGRSQARR